MKSKDVLSLLNISRSTLTNLVKSGKIRVVKLPNNYYDYNSEDVYAYLGKSNDRLNVIYARVSGKRHKSELDFQVKELSGYCEKHGYKVDRVYKEIAIGIDIENRPELYKLIDLVLDNQISRVFILYKDRFGKSCYNLFKQLFARFGAQIIIVNENSDWGLENSEMFDEITSLLGTFSSWSNTNGNNYQKLLSKRTKKSDTTKQNLG